MLAVKAYPASELLELSIGFEEDTQKLYERWARKFSRLPDVAAFWRDYAKDEGTHARLLKELRARLSPDQKATLIECELVGDTRRLLISIEEDERAHKIIDLEQAYQYASQLERSEINPLFMIITSFFEADEEAKAMLRSLIDQHIHKVINNFPERISSSTQRREIKVVP